MADTSGYAYTFNKIVLAMVKHAPVGGKRRTKSELGALANKYWMREKFARGLTPNFKKRCGRSSAWKKVMQRANEQSNADKKNEEECGVVLSILEAHIQSAREEVKDLKEQVEEAREGNKSASGPVDIYGIEVVCPPGVSFDEQPERCKLEGTFAKTGDFGIDQESKDHFQLVEEVTAKHLSLITRELEKLEEARALLEKNCEEARGSLSEATVPVSTSASTATPTHVGSSSSVVLQASPPPRVTARNFAEHLKSDELAALKGPAHNEKVARAARELAATLPDASLTQLVKFLEKVALNPKQRKCKLPIGAAGDDMRSLFELIEFEYDSETGEMKGFGDTQSAREALKSMRPDFRLAASKN